MEPNSIAMRILVFLILFYATITTAQTKKLQAETNHSSVVFEIPVAGFTLVNGRFNTFTIEMDWNVAHPDSSTIRAKIHSNSIDTGIDDRDAHLRSEDFFNATKYPYIEFISDSIQRVNYANFKAFGTLNMHGVEKPYVLPLELVKADGNTLGFRSRTSLNRLDYGVGKDFIHSSMPDFLPDTILVRIDFWTKRRKE